ncbi:DUF2642 domain-containing protein [Microaerobacter geothermalis]|uniref:DUF2642 domain-containing protein n=1 Tax=Microaerobacter geothermalis TaxID=674972 RepID=UPI001F44D044|nr:DUF2642 domain-containing protein [Microaerobacter geothermalis]MCF6093579.1 DUF2642 domain-containing protein [Microaerobacter geothermalis]
MIFYKQFLGKVVDVEISGNKKSTGILIDTGQDLLVIYNGEHYQYIPSSHIQHLKPNTNNNSNISNHTDPPFDNENELTYRKVLNNAKGLFVEINVGDQLSIHGYLINILTDYFVVYSPVYGLIFIQLFHVKCIVPYLYDQIPYSMEGQFLPINPLANISLVRTFEQQLKKLEGKLVVFDIGLKENKIGLLRKVENGIGELVTARGKEYYWNIHHLKTAHIPNV